MNENNFDEKSAKEWIRIIEDETSKIREKDIYPILKEWCDQVAPSKILDIGCGQGVCSEKINLQTSEYVGIDPSPFLINRANELYSTKNKLFQIGNAYQIPATDAAYDAAFSIAVWHLLSDLKKAACELSRILKFKGSFLIVTANPEFYDEWTSGYTISSLDGKRFEGKFEELWSTDVLYLHELDEIINSLREEFLQIQRVETFRKFILIHGHKHPSL